MGYCAAAVLMLAAPPVAASAIQNAGVAIADPCASVGGRHVDVGGCADPDAAVDAPLPEEAPPPYDAPPPPEACASVGGRHVSVGGCD
jgi:hypothetical protein